MQEIKTPNVNSVRGKLISLQAATDSQNSHIVAITETKGNPPTLEGYAPWYHRPRGECDGGGVAITVRNDLKQNSQLVDDQEQPGNRMDTNQPKHEKQNLHRCILRKQ